MLILVLPVVSKDKSAYKFNNIGFDYQKKAMYNEAIENYELAISTDSNYFPACNNLGTVYYLLGDYKTAIEYFDKAVSLKTDSYAAHYSLGMALLNHYDKQIESVLEPLETGKSRYVMIKASYNTLLEEAVVELKTALRHNDKSYQSRTALGIAYLKMNMLHKAIKELNIALAINPDYPIANYYMGIALKNNSDSLCVTYFKKAVSVDPNYTKAYVELGHALALKSRCQEALYYAECGLKIFKNIHHYPEIKDNFVSLGTMKVDSKVSYTKIGYSGNSKLYNAYQTNVDDGDKEKLSNLFSYLTSL